MKLGPFFLAFGLLGFMLGLIVAGNAMIHAAAGRAPAHEVARPRYQISAWGGGDQPSAGTFESSVSREKSFCVIDVVTGELWNVVPDGEPRKIAEKLR